MEGHLSLCVYMGLCVKEDCVMQFYLQVADTGEGSGIPIMSCPCLPEAPAVWGQWAEGHVGLGPGCCESVLESFLEGVEPLT